MSFSGNCRYALVALLFSAGLMGCSVEERGGDPLYSLELREEYGAEPPRSVAVTVNIGQGDGNTLELSKVRLAVTPPSPHSLNKLESQLGESTLINEPGQSWPETVLRPVPQAVPVLTRIQTAIAILKPQDLRIERATANVFDSPPAIGFTRMETRGSVVSIATIALTAVDSKAITGVAAVLGNRTLTGKPTEHGFTLKGKRWILGESAASLLVSGQVRPAGAPAQNQEKTVER